MDVLPHDDKLSIQLLSQCFNDTTNSYKFYWFWAILDHLNEKDKLEISIDELSLRMISLAWYPLDYYKLSFGKSDSFKILAKQISNTLVVDNRPNSASLYNQILNHPDTDLKNRLKGEISRTLKRWVIYRFVRPFFQKKLTGLKDSAINTNIERLANLNKDLTPYFFKQNSIIITPYWHRYLMQNQHILRGFIKWHLLNFLQKNNPNVIGLSEKLEKPLSRNLTFAKKFWSSYLMSNPSTCVYSKVLLNPATISLDHFIPWSYIVHDQLWNIIPTTKNVNSAKSDTLPDLRYLNNFYAIQYKALQYHAQNNTALIEDHLNLLRLDLGSLAELKYDDFCIQMNTEINAHIRSAKNLGFKDGFTF